MRNTFVYNYSLSNILHAKHDIKIDNVNSTNRDIEIDHAHSTNRDKEIDVNRISLGVEIGKVNSTNGNISHNVYEHCNYD